MEVIVIFFLLILGASLGSFFNVCISRLPRKQSIAFPSSHCPKCKTKIKWYHNIPIFSYLLLGGKCKYCGSKIHWHYLLIEIITPLLFIGLFILNQYQLDFFFLKYSVYLSFIIVIFFIDLFHKVILDKMSLPLIALGLLANISPANDISLVNSLLGSGFGFSLFYLIAYIYYKRNNAIGLGGGDIKFIAAIGAFMGFSGVLFIILFSSIIALLVILPFKKIRKQEFPFGPFLILGSLLYLYIGHFVIAWYLNFFL